MHSGNSIFAWNCAFPRAGRIIFIYVRTSPNLACLWITDFYFKSSTGCLAQFSMRDLARELSSIRWHMLHSSPSVVCVWSMTFRLWLLFLSIIVIIIISQVRLYFVSDSGIALNRSLQRQDSRVLCLVWHNGGEHIVTGGADSAIRVIHVPSASCRNRITLDDYKEKASAVWDVKFISDSLLVSANSVGKVHIWDFYTSTLQSVFSLHAADVLTLAVQERGDANCVFASGVDSVILQLSRVPSVPNKCKNQVKWIPSGQIRPHQHDVFSMHISPTGLLASGGIEGDLVITKTSSFNKCGFVKYQPFPCMSRHFKLAKSGDVLLCQDISTIRLWQFSPSSSGMPGVVSQCREQEAMNMTSALPQCDSKKSTPTCLLELRSKPPHNILSSAISPDAKKIAVSNSFEVWVYAFNNLKFELSLISHFFHPSSFMLFTPDQRNLLLATTTEGLKSVTCEEMDKIIVDTISNVAIKEFELSADGQYLAALTKSWKVHVFDLGKGTSFAKLPAFPALPIAMTFNPSTPEIVVFSGGECRQVFVYHLENLKLDCLGELRKELKNNDFQGRTKLSHPLSILPIMSERNLFSVYDNDCVMLFRLNTKCAQSTIPCATKKRLCQERTISVQLIKTASPVVFIGIYYKYLAEKQKPTMILVERSQRSLLQTLPPTLYRKRFGV